MNKPSKIFLGVVVFALLVALFLYFRQGAGSSPPPASSPAPAPVARVAPSVLPLAPVAQVAAPVLPPAPAGASDPAGTNADVAALDNAVADIAHLLQKGNFEAVANNYSLPGQEKELLRVFQNFQKEGESGQIRLRQLSKVFVTMAGQTPEIHSGSNRAIFLDRTIYGIVPPIPLEKLPPGMDPDTIIRIPLVFAKQDGHWYLAAGINNLIGPLHNVRIDKMSEANP